MVHVIVLAGGTSDEREISLRSGAAVVEALKKHGHDARLIDPADGLQEQLPELRTADVVFPALHGAGGEDGTVQRFLEKHSIRYAGPDSQSSALCFDKARYTKLLENNNILTPKTELVNLQAFQSSGLSKQPFVLKPNDGGSSVDTFIVRQAGNSDDAAIGQAFMKHEKLLLQELINGDEITVAILGEEALPAIEIIPPEGGEFDYENKYNGQTQELCPPKHVDQAAQEHAKSLSKRIHELTGCRDMSRTDIIVADDKQYVLETNTIPGLTNESLLPKAAAAAGYDIPTMCDMLVQMALERDT